MYDKVHKDLDTRAGNSFVTVMIDAKEFQWWPIAI